jgi:hypothetical protein
MTIVRVFTVVRAPDRGLERALGQAHANAILADDRRPVTADFWFLWVRCSACRTTNAIDLRTLDRHRNAAVTSLIPALSCRLCRPNAPFAELVVANEHRR